MATIKDQLLKGVNTMLDSLGIRESSSLYIKSLGGEVLAYQHHLSSSQADKFIDKFVQANSKMRFLHIEYEKNKIPNWDFIYDTIAKKTYLPFHQWNSLPEITQIYLVSAIPIGIDKIKNPSEAVQMAAIKQNPGCITLLDSPCEAAQIYVAQQDPFVISLISPTEKTILTAVEKDPSVFKYIKNPSEELQKLVVKQVPTAIRYIDDPSESIQLIAIEKNPHTIGDIASPTEKAQLIAVKKECLVFSEINCPTPQTCKTVIEQLCNKEINIDITRLSSMNDFCSDSQILVDNLIDFPDEQKDLLSAFENKYSSTFTKLEKEATNINISTDKQKEIAGTISYLEWNGEICETQEFENAESYLKCIKDQLYINPDGFRCKTITNNAEVRKAVDDMFYGECGVDNPHSIEWYYPKSELNPSISLNQEIQSSGSRTLIGDYHTGKDSQMTNLRIRDSSTGKVEPLQTNGVDLSKESPEVLNKLLSSGKAQSKTGSFQLSKTAIGWSLTAAKQIFSTVDASAGI